MAFYHSLSAGVCTARAPGAAGPRITSRQPRASPQHSALCTSFLGNAAASVHLTSLKQFPSMQRPGSRGLAAAHPRALFGQRANVAVKPPPSPAPSSPTIKSVYSTGKPLKLNLPKLSYIGATQSDETPSNPVGWQSNYNLPPPQLSKTDEEFALQHGVQFVEGYDELDINELNDLFELVGFPRRAPQRLHLALQHTHRIIWIRCIRRTRAGRVGKLVGFARATSDGHLTSTIWDVAVNPGWQRCGMGTGMIERLLCGLVADGIPVINLYAEPHVVKMYEGLGFVKDPEDPSAASLSKEGAKELIVSK